MFTFVFTCLHLYVHVYIDHVHVYIVGSGKVLVFVPVRGVTNRRDAWITFKLIEVIVARFMYMYIHI
jgi:hypothetical protein